MKNLKSLIILFVIYRVSVLTVKVVSEVYPLTVWFRELLILSTTIVGSICYYKYIEKVKK